jgi:hypothetical protein
MNALMKELQHTIIVEDPYGYNIEKRIKNCIVDRKYHLIAFYEGSYADKNIDKNYWIGVKYMYLPTKLRGTNIVWYEFKGKHIQIIN